MNRLRTLIVDDEPLAVERLEILSRDHPAIEIVGTANDGVQHFSAKSRVLLHERFKLGVAHNRANAGF